MCSAALRRLGGTSAASAIAKERRPARPAAARKIPQAVRHCLALCARLCLSALAHGVRWQVGARFYNDYGETLQLFWDAPGPNPRGSFLQGSIIPGATLRMKSYVGHAFHAELAGERVWSQKLNDKTRQWCVCAVRPDGAPSMLIARCACSRYTIDRSQKQETTQDLFAGWSLSGDDPAAGGGAGGGAAPPPIGGIGPEAETMDEML
eukprot:COSAG04_NODE_1713_length_5822_cov_50.309977_5_plen_207_part_00